ncbi:MAG: DUF4198 domain-containing protein [Synergistaceae bacterium]|nr:DUF4198 domain-containing protein [Synergistaceae bacterium]
MNNKTFLSRRSPRITALFLWAFFFVLVFAPPLSAHTHMAFPEWNSAPAGAKVKIVSSLSEPLPTPDYSAYELGGTVSGFVLNPDGSRTDLPGFVPFDTRTGKTYTKAELDAIDPERIHDTVNGNLTYAPIASSAGTSVVAATMSFGTTVCFAKTFINIKNDDNLKRIVGDNTGMELVPVTNIAGEDSKARFRLYFKGAPHGGAAVRVSFNGCADYEIDPDQPVMAEATTGASGEVELPMPDKNTDCYIFAEAEIDETRYRASLHFHFGEEETAPEDLAGLIMAPGRNSTDLTFAVEMGAFAVHWLESMDFSWIQFLVSEPKGSAANITGEEGQIGGNSGYSFTIPTDSTVGNLRPIIGAYAMNLVFTPDNLGQERYDEIVRQAGAGEGGTLLPGGIFVPDPGFLGRNGLHLMARFADGAVEDLSDVFQCYFFLENSESGSFGALVGGLFADSPTVDGKHYDVRTATDPDNPEESDVLPFIFDGKPDGVVQGEFWVSAGSGSGKNGGGGCSTGSSLSALAVALFAFTARRKR